MSFKFQKETTDDEKELIYGVWGVTFVMLPMGGLLTTVVLQGIVPYHIIWALGAASFIIGFACIIVADRYYYKR